MSKADVFQRDVFALTRAIPYGRVTSYGAIARSIGAAGAARRVGWVLNTSFNVVPPVPAHRVVNRQGLLTGRMHFPEDHPMEAQLKAEGVEISDCGVVNFCRKVLGPSSRMVGLNVK